MPDITSLSRKRRKKPEKHKLQDRGETMGLRDCLVSRQKQSEKFKGSGRGRAVPREEPWLGLGSPTSDPFIKVPFFHPASLSSKERRVD
jgi:hypothetical protein